jgi:hypothetical protein
MRAGNAGVTYSHADIKFLKSSAEVALVGWIERSETQHTRAGQGCPPEWPQVFLSKPYRLEDLREAICRVVTGHGEV